MALSESFLVGMLAAGAGAGPGVCASAGGFDDGDDPHTEPDGTNLLPDDMLEEVVVDQDAATPVPEALGGACFACTGGVVTITRAAPAPACVREARAIDRCVAIVGGGWALCAGKFLLRLGGFVFYFGVERRVAPEARPPDGLERRRSKTTTPVPLSRGAS